MKLTATELTDGYKLEHRRQYPEGTEYVYSNWTARSNEYFPETDGVVVFGIQYLLKEYFIKRFNQDFFNISEDEAVKTFSRRVNTFLGENNVGEDHIRNLHRLGYLPVKVKALPEGSLCPIKVPMLTIINTLPEFFWITNFLETIMSSVLWLPMTSATTARVYMKELLKHAKKTGFDHEMIGFNCHDFSMRGMAGLEAAIMSGMGHLTSFVGSETIPALYACEEYYNADGEKELIAATIPASEHSVMCAGGDGEDELKTFERFITEIYPSGFVSIVSDTWDLWKVMTEYLPLLKDKILARYGRLVIRPDSGCPEDIICGNINNYKCIDYTLDSLTTDILWNNCNGYRMNFENINELYYLTSDSVLVRYYREQCEIKNWKYFIEIIDSPEAKGAYEILWDIFGGTINEKGYKVLNPKVGIIYGDSITLERQKEIYKRLEEKGFCASNLVLGIGSYTYQYRTRDSLGFAMKATWCQINGEGKEIYKKPKTDNGIKNSLKGLIYVQHNGYDGKYEAIDCVDKDTEDKGELKVVFEDGKLIKDFTLQEVRDNVKNTI